MPRTTRKATTSEKGGSSSPPAVAKAPDARQYVALRRSGYSHKQACQQSGYSPLTRTRDIERTLYAHLAAQSLEEQRAQLRDVPGYSFTDCIKVAGVTRDRKNQNPDVILKANRQIIDILGYDAPKEINITEQRNLAIAIGILHQIAAHPSMIVHTSPTPDPQAIDIQHDTQGYPRIDNPLTPQHVE
jgi:hypothetical protein